MSPVLGAALLAMGIGAISAFAAYWMGRATGERNLRIVQARYALMTQTSIDLACSLAHLKRHYGHLTPEEADAFIAITTNFGKESA